MVIKLNWTINSQWSCPMPSLFDPYNLGPFHLKNRLVMAPMERSRARNPGWVPDADTARYFSRRAGAGLIVTGSIALSE